MIKKTIQITRKKIISALKTANISSAEIDAEVLLEFATKKSREFLLANPDSELSDIEIKQLNILVERRKKYEPIAYVTGQKEFFGLNFLVTPDVLIPRPETELLVENAINFIGNKKNSKVLDVGTGSGNIIISIAKNICGKFTASDISNCALKVALNNAARHKVDIKFIKSDLFENISGKFDLIVANLPYVPIDGSDDLEIKHEPQSAIFAQENGEKIIKDFLLQAKNHLDMSGLILLELDHRNAKSLATFATKLFSSVKILKDYSNKERFLEISK